MKPCFSRAVPQRYLTGCLLSLAQIKLFSLPSTDRLFTIPNDSVNKHCVERRLGLALPGTAQKSLGMVVLVMRITVTVTALSCV